MADSASDKRDRVGLVTIIFMPVIALCFDLIAIIPGTNLLAWIVLGIWFLLLDVNIFSARNMAATVTSAIIGLVPVLNLLPEITLAVIVIIFMIKSEDKLGIKVPTLK